MSQIPKTVRVNALQPGMVITEVTELSFDYATLDETGLKFIQNAFKGARGLIIKDGDPKVVPVEDLKVLDSLQAIMGIDKSLKAAQVVDGLPAFLEKHGLLEFKVIGADGTPAKATTPAPAVHAKKEEAASPGNAEARKRHEHVRREARQLMDKVAVAKEDREKASNVVADMLDQGRQGKYTSGGVETMVDDILKQGSTQAMKAIAGLRSSDQTYAHCTDMSVILQESYVAILEKGGKKTTDSNARFALMAGFMHDIGKSEVPKEILESTERYAADSKEMILMRNHTVYGARILSDMGMPEVTINVANFHHVKMDDTLLNSYPKSRKDAIMPITRLAAICDVYQALIGRRSYKRNWVPAKAIEYLLSLEGSEFDGKVLREFVQVTGVFPVGSLLRLSTGDLGYVMVLAPHDHPRRPTLALVENAKGEMLTSNTLVDLMMEPEIEVMEVVDHYAHYNESEDQAYRVFESINVL